jgi:hypothetical protein
MSTKESSPPPKSHSEKSSKPASKKRYFGTTLSPITHKCILSTILGRTYNSKEISTSKKEVHKTATMKPSTTRKTKKYPTNSSLANLNPTTISNNGRIKTGNSKNKLTMEPKP